MVLLQVNSVISRSKEIEMMVEDYNFKVFGNGKKIRDRTENGGGGISWFYGPIWEKIHFIKQIQEGTLSLRNTFKCWEKKFLHESQQVKSTLREQKQWKKIGP